MRYLSSLTLILALSLTAHSQDKSFDNVIAKKRYVDCHDIEFNTLSVIQQLYEAHEIDSLYRFINYWKSNCGLNEQQFRLTRILDIRNKNFSPDQITQGWFEYLIQFKAIETELPADWNQDANVRDLYAIRLRLDHYIKKIARETPVPDNIDARLMLEFYSMDSPSFEQIKNASPNESKLSSFYHIEAENARRMAEGHLAIMGGFIQPFGNLSLVGIRPSLGFMLGGKKIRSNYDVVLDFRFGPSSNDYTIQYMDTLLKVHKYTGLYVGGEYSYDIISRDKISFALASGIGYEQITALSSDNDFGDESKSIPTLNINCGFVLKCFFKIDKYIGFHARYNFVDFSNAGGTDISGDYFCLRVVYGSTTTPVKHRRMKLLGLRD